MSPIPFFLNIERVLRNMIDAVIGDMGFEIHSYNITVNQNQAFGDYSTNIALLLAKKEQVSSLTLAHKLTQLLVRKNDSGIIKEIKTENNGFINFWVAESILSDTLDYILNEDLPLKGFALDSKTTYIIEYSSPNMVKPFTIGYLRSTIVGEAVANIFSYSGRKVIRDNHLGDWGIQFGKLIYAVKMWSTKETIESSVNPYLLLIGLYLKFVNAEKVDPSLKQAFALEYQKLEEGNVSSIELWQWLKQILTEGINKIYTRLDLKFDVISWESLFVTKALDVIARLISTKIAVVSNHATVVFFEKLPPLILKKTDGTTLYPSREIACDIDRKNRYGSCLVIINEVGSDQEIYLQQIFNVEVKMGLFEYEQRIHLKHGMYKLEGIKMVSEKGNYVYLEDVLDFAKNTVITRFPNITDSDAEIIGQAAIRFNDLKNPHQSDVAFNMNTVTNMGNGSGPYLQYTIHRARSIKKEYPLNSLERITSFRENEYEIVRHLQKCYKYFDYSLKELSTHHIATFASKLASMYNHYYGSFQTLEKSRTIGVISHCTEKMLHVCLSLLGIKIPEKMS